MRMGLRLPHRWPAVAALALSAALSFGRGNDLPSGTVTGHVYCADTNTAARFASVMLQPIEPVTKDAGRGAGNGASKEADKDAVSGAGKDAVGGANKDPDKEVKGDEKSGEGKAAVQYRIPDKYEMTVAQTGLDGSFTIGKVKPGTYFVVVEKPGYLSPMGQLAGGGSQKLTQEELAKIEPGKITVEANQTVQVEERIERGAAVSGIVTYDDGSPAAELNIQLLRKTGEGTWENVSITSHRSIPYQTTDDVGRFRIVGLPSGEYMVEVDLSLSESKITRDGSSSGGGGSGNSGAYPLAIFSGGTARKKDAASFKLKVGEERGGEDIVIPLSKLHRVTGSLIAERDGHVINWGLVMLWSVSGRELVGRSGVGPEQLAFDFPFVPEGDYVLSVPDAIDVVAQEDPKQPGQPHYQTITGVDTQGAQNLTEKDLQYYGYREEPLTIRGDVLDLVVSLPTKPAVPGSPKP